MDSFESVIASLLRQEGYWTWLSYKVELTKAQKREIDRPSAPRWELDIVAYQPAANRLLVVECKSLLDSRGVHFDGHQLCPPGKYKLFNEPQLREVVLRRLSEQLAERGLVAGEPTTRLCLAAGNITRQSDRMALRAYFQQLGGYLFDEQWITERLSRAAAGRYENNVGVVVAKLIHRNSS